MDNFYSMTGWSSGRGKPVTQADQEAHDAKIREVTRLNAELEEEARQRNIAMLRAKHAEAKAKVEELQKLTRNGFKPFTLYLSDGRSFDVPHPDFINVSPTGRMLIVYQPDESFEMIDILLVTSFETFGKNGARKRRQRKTRR